MFRLFCSTKKGGFSGEQPELLPLREETYVTLVENNEKRLVRLVSSRRSCGYLSCTDVASSSQSDPIIGTYEDRLGSHDGTSVGVSLTCAYWPASSDSLGVLFKKMPSTRGGHVKSRLE